MAKSVRLPNSKKVCGLLLTSGYSTKENVPLILPSAINCIYAHRKEVPLDSRLYIMLTV